MGTLRVLLPVGLPPHLLIPIFAALRQRHPKLRVSAQFSNHPQQSRLDDVDLVVYFGPRHPPGNWIVHEVAQLREWLVARRSYLQQRGTPCTIEDLNNHELFTWQAPGQTADTWPTVRGGAFLVQPVMVATDVHLIRQFALAGLGIALLPDGLLPDPGVAPGELVPVLQDVVGRDLSMLAAVPSALAQVPKVKALLQAVRELLGPR